MEKTNQKENEAFLKEQIITYLGNKRSLLKLIGCAISHVQRDLGKEKLGCFDAFAGSGIVSRYLKQFSSELFTNDLETYTRVINTCYLANADEVPGNLPELHRELMVTIRNSWRPGIISHHYAPRNDQNIQPGERVFYTRRNAEFLDTARQAIALMPRNEQPFFLAPLLHEASVHTNTGGVFKGFYKNKQGIGQFGGSGRHALSRITADITLPLPVFSRFNVKKHILQMDAYEAARQLPPLDVAYLDPPYNQHPYGSNYFMLNLLSNYQKPEEISPISGIPRQWNRSNYNKKNKVTEELERLIQATPATYILLSYNSEGLLPPKSLLALLQTFGQVKTLAQEYQTFRASRNLRNRPGKVKEFLYILRKK